MIGHFAYTVVRENVAHGYDFVATLKVHCLPMSDKKDARLN